MSKTSKTQAEKVAAFRALHEREGAFSFPNPWDVGSAKILEAQGFEALATTSGGFAWTLGRLDGDVTLDEKIEHCRQLCAAVDVPVAADLGMGFGDAPADVARAITEGSAAGLAGGSIEDSSAVYGGHIYEFSQAVERIEAAVEAGRATDAGFVLTARCEHFVQGGTDFDDTLKRLLAYEKAGADVLYATGIVDLEQIRTLCAELSKPVNVLVGFNGMDLTFDQLAEVGVKRVSIGVQLAKIAYGAALLAAKELKATNGIIEFENNVRSKDLVSSFV